MIRSARRASAAAAILAASLALNACSSSLSNVAGSSRSAVRSSSSPAGLTTSGRVLNTLAVELAIEHRALTQRGKHIRVSCPSGIPQRKGVVFYCTAYYARSTTPFTVTEVDGVGDVHYAAR